MNDMKPFNQANREPKLFSGMWVFLKNAANTSSPLHRHSACRRGLPA